MAQVLATARNSTLDEMESLYWSLDEDTGRRAELIGGQLIMNPGPVLWHCDVSTWLFLQFNATCQANNWTQYQTADLVLPQTRDIVVPDLMIIKDREKLPRYQQAVPPEHALLVAEITSPSSTGTDRTVKWLSYAKAGIPLYLLVDRLARASTVTLFSAPGKGGYTTSRAAGTGRAGGRLAIPAPLGCVLDTTTMP
jgi:Uma2 family endonuclease